MNDIMGLPRRIEDRRVLVFAMLWLGYAGYYLGRANLAPLMASMIGDLRLNRVDVGWIASAMFWAYAIGQFVNGRLGDRRNARVYIGVGLVISALLNLGMTTCHAVVSLALVWGLNGFAQSIGWPMAVKTAALWFPEGNRGRVAGLLATSYILGSAASVALAGTVAESLSWRAGFVVPAILMVALAGLWWLLGNDRPPGDKFLVNSGRSVGTSETDRPRTPERDIIFDPRVWMTAGALCGLNVVRYGFMTWAPLYLFETQGASISKAAWSTAILPAAGAIGAVVAGHASDRYFRGQRAPITIIAFATVALLIVYFRFGVPEKEWLLSLGTLATIGFFLFGAHALIVAAVPIDVGRGRRSSSATGFIDGWGYIGAGLEGVVTGWLVDHWGWSAGFIFWVVSALVGAGFAVALLNLDRKPPRGAVR